MIDNKWNINYVTTEYAQRHIKDKKALLVDSLSRIFNDTESQDSSEAVQQRAQKWLPECMQVSLQLPDD